MALVLGGGMARANDSAAELGAGGVVLTKSTSIVMESEDLFISRERVRVAYVFRNVGPSDVRTRVAFPVPDIPECDEDASGDCDGDLQMDSLPNPMHFTVHADGKPIAFETEIKRPPKVNGVGVVKVVHHWEQVFPKDARVKITHEYVPVAGGFFTDTGPRNDEFKRRMAEAYCVGPKLLARMVKTQDYLRTVHYILSTAANWRGPIGHFKLTIAKKSPAEKVSVCVADTRKASPTTFEVVRESFVPEQDLRILFIPAPGQD